MSTILDKRGNAFEIVEHVPAGFKIWNIPQIDESGEYLALYEPLNPGDRKDFRVNTQTLKAIKLRAEMTARLSSAACWGVRTPEDAERAIASKGKGIRADRKREVAQAAIGDFEELWDR